MNDRPEGRNNRTGRGTLTFVAALLLSSALIRIATEAGASMASDNTTSLADPAELGAHDQLANSTDADIQMMLDALQERDDRLSAWEERLEMRVQALNFADQEIERKLAELVVAEEKLRDTLAYADTAAEDDIARLTSVYETMKPKEAAALFEAMDPEFAAGFLGRMRADAAAGILAGLTPQAAYTVSVLLAGRNANVPRQ